MDRSIAKIASHVFFLTVMAVGAGQVHAAELTLFAGQLGVAGSKDGKAAQATFNFPSNVVVDPQGDVYVADYANQLIRKIDPDGTVSTLAGKALAQGKTNGRGAKARFNGPGCLSLDPYGNLFVRDVSDGRIRKVAPDGTVSNFPGSGTVSWPDAYGNAVGVTMTGPLTSDGKGGLFVADNVSEVIRRVSALGDAVVLVGSGKPNAEDGTGTDASISQIEAMTTDAEGNLYFVDGGNNSLRKLNTSGKVTTLFQGGDAIKYAQGLAMDKKGNFYVSCQLSAIIQKITPEGVLSTYEGPILSAEGQKKNPDSKEPTMLGGIAIGPSGDIYVADSLNQVIWRIH
ncbi:MAG TPA: hypothetical protein VHE12_11590 [bacterium]|nr:hypothetical protein [bacterium]